MPIIIFLCSSNYSFLLGSGCFHNSPTLSLLTLPCVWLGFSCNHIGFCCCFSLIGFTGMNADCCSPKCILTASQHGFPRHQKLPANFLPFVSHSFGVCSPAAQGFRTSFISAVLELHTLFSSRTVNFSRKQKSSFLLGRSKCTSNHGTMLVNHYEKL